MTTVVAGILERDGRILICQRKADQAHPLKWEFPGGKLEAGEEPEAALQRELNEELGIVAGPVREMARYEFAYPGKSPILLIFLAVAEWGGAMENRIFNQMLWEEKARLPEYDLLEGDRPFLEMNL
jgi:8-oxo-dGTP diphosphatase